MPVFSIIGVSTLKVALHGISFCWCIGIIIPCIAIIGKGSSYSFILFICMRFIAGIGEPSFTFHVINSIETISPDIDWIAFVDTASPIGVSLGYLISGFIIDSKNISNLFGLKNTSNNRGLIFIFETILMSITMNFGIFYLKVE